MTTNPQRYGLWFPVVLCLLVQVLWVALAASPVLDGELIGPDSYMRLHRVTRLHETGDWFDISIPRANAPYGEVMHWTRPFDALLLAGAWLGAPFGGFEDALLWSGALVSPLLQVLAVIAMMWAGRPFLAPDRLLLLGLMFVVLPGATPYFMAGRADHHGLNMLLFVLSLGFVVRLLVDRFRAGVCHGAGLVAALSLWVSIEALAALAVNLAVLTLYWILSGREMGRKVFHLSAALFAGLAIAIFVERPWPALLEAKYDRLSVVHWLLGGLILAFWALVVLSGRDLRPLARLAAAGAWGLFSGGVMWAVFPGFFRGPLADMDPAVAALLFNRIAEIQPLIDPGDIGAGAAILFLGTALPGLPFLAWIAWTQRRSEVHAAWVYIILGLMLYIPLTLYQRRWAGYPEILLLLPYAELLARVLERTVDIRWRAVVRALLISGFAVGFLILGLVVMKLENGTDKTSVGSRDCRIARAARHLDDAGGWGDRRRTILASVDFGPELLYRTRHRVVATAYHRHRAGLLAARRIMTATDDGEALELVRERQIDLILLCPRSNEGTFFDPAGGGATLYRRLVEGRPPRWLRAAPLPSPLAAELKLYEVIR